MLCGPFASFAQFAAKNLRKNPRNPPLVVQRVFSQPLRLFTSHLQPLHGSPQRSAKTLCVMSTRAAEGRQ